MPPLTAQSAAAPPVLRLGELDAADAARVAVLLDQALDQPVSQRAAFAARLLQDEPRLGALVGELLAALTVPDDATRAETLALVQRQLQRHAVQVAGTASLRGRRFGPYRVLDLLGQGGMGSVWLAERDDGLFQRRVALKLVHPGLAGRVVDERFARERSILGALDHPHIARLLDAGVSGDGQPYLAIEYVEGAPLTDYCDTRRLDLRARVQLLLQVLSAVQYAHQNLVIHRDLKPANILVTPQGQVRLLDFGIAKLMTDGAQGAETELTQLGGRALTPNYASPEQIAGGAVSTASDVYSLGVVLYTLLCGQRPYQLRRDSRGALEDAILSAPPLRPSQQAADDASAQARATTPRRLAQALGGDLDTIVLKALKKEPAARYPTAAALAQDLQRWLAGEPVLARPDGALYRVRKFVVRHRLAVGAASLAASLVVAGALASLWQAGVARRQAAVAQRESQRAQAVQAFLLDIFKANSVLQPDPLRAQQTTARELLDVGARRAAESLEAAPEAQVEVLNTLSDMYWQINLHDEAAQMRLQAIEAMKRAYGAGDVRVAHALLHYSRAVSTTNRRERAAQALAQARAILDAAGDHASETRGRLYIESVNLQQYLSMRRMREDADAAVRHFTRHPAHWTNLFQALQASARASYLAGDHAAAEARHHEALAHLQRHQPGVSSWIITPWVQLAESQMSQLKLDAAERHLRDALEAARRLHGPLNGISLQTQAKLGGFLHATGRRAQGRDVLLAARAAVQDKAANATPDAVAAVDRFLGAALVADGRLAEGEHHLAAEVADLRAHYPDSVPLARTLLLQAQALTALGRYDASRRVLDDAWRIWVATGGDAVDPATRNRYLLAQAGLDLALGDAGTALQRLQRVQPPRDAASLPLPLEQLQAQVARAHVLRLQGQGGAAATQARAALAPLQASPLRARFASLEADALLQLGLALHAGGDAQAALAPLEQALALRRAQDDAASPWIAEAQVALAAALAARGQHRPARALEAQAAAIQARHAELGRHLRAPLQELRRRLARP